MTKRILCPILAATLLVACGGDDERVPIDAAPTVDATATPIDAAPDAPSGTVCGGLAGAACGPTEYCDFAGNTCGSTDETGVCAPRPVGCPDLLIAIPTCGCDGVVYSSPCDALAAGADLDASGSCPVPAGAFACGYAQCDLRTGYCRHDLSDVVGEPDTFTCVAVPSCPSEFPTCACLAGEPCGDACTGVGATGLTLTCPGG
ncbi:MAG: hypothetical protein IPL61_38015 [Myxococcales bacterium]|nr:hypothetical protein [Myxococcales bacterium]